MDREIHSNEAVRTDSQEKNVKEMNHWKMWNPYITVFQGNPIFAEARVAGQKQRFDAKSNTNGDMSHQAEQY